MVVFVRDTLPPGNRNYMSNRTYPYEFSEPISLIGATMRQLTSERTTLVDTPS